MCQSPINEGLESKNLENKKRIHNLAKVFDANCLTNYLNFKENERACKSDQGGV